MHWLIWVFIAVFFGVSYRIGYKLLSGFPNPLLNVSIISLIASLVCFVLYLCREQSSAAFHVPEWRLLWPLVIVGIALAGLEISVMMIYRSGGPLSIAQSMSSSLVGIIIFAIGVIAFKDQLNMEQIIGFALGLSGVTLMTYSSR